MSDTGTADRSPLYRRLPLLDATAALIVIASMRHGGFYPPDDLRVPGLAAAVALVAIVVNRRALHRRDWAVVVPLLLLGLWWYVTAVDHGDWSHARQGEGSIVGFAACFLVGRTLADRSRLALRSGALLFGSLTSVVGLVGLALRVEPLALPAQAHFRLAGTLTYSNATGALLAMLVLVAITCPASRFRDPQVVLIAGALVATQSRASLLAVLLALPLVRRHLPAAMLPLGVGGLLGVTAVAGSGGTSEHPELLVVTGLLAAAAVALRGRQLSARATLITVVAAGALVVAAVVTSHGFVDAFRSRVGTASVSDRDYEWRAGWHAFTTSPVSGAGPGIRLQLSDGRTARFVHNEPLQVGADCGLIGVALLGAAFGGALLRRRADHIVEGGAAVLTSFVVCGLLDFPWHLPAITMTAGLLIGGLPHKPAQSVDRLQDSASAATNGIT